MLTFQHTKLRWSARDLLSYVLPILFFVTPISSSLKSIFMGIAVAIIIGSSSYRQQIVHIFSKRWCQSAILLFVIALFAVAWSPAFLNEKMLALEKWSKLLYLPLLVVGFSDEKTRSVALNAFILAMSLVCVLSILVTAGFFQNLHMNADAIFRNHIMTGIMVSFAAYVSAFLCFKYRGHRRFAYFLLSILFTYQVLFISNGRTGYVIYFLLMGLLIIQMLRFKQALIGLMMLCSSVIACYYASYPMQHGIKRVVMEMQMYQQNKNTSVGYRMQFHDYAKHLFKEHWLVGGGTGSFTHSFKEDNPVPEWVNDSHHSGRLLEPHSQYWFTAAELGLFGLMGLVLFYLSLFAATWKMTTMRPIALGVLLIMVVGNLSDSLLFYSGSGYFLILFLALCLSERAGIEKKGFYEP